MQLRSLETYSWSLLDVVVYTILMLKVGAKWWQSLNYFGEGILAADMCVLNLPVARGSVGQFTKFFGPGGGDYGMRPEVLNVHVQQRPAAQANVLVNFANMREDIPTLVTSLMNSLLRSLGHGVLWDEFKDNVSVIASGTGP